MRMRRPAEQSKALTVAQARVQLKTLLAGARSLDRFNADDLARSYRLPAKEIAQMLEQARSRHGGLL